VRIESVPTVRESDGLAMSSRNQYLSDQERQTAVEIINTLRGIEQQLKQGMHDFSELETSATNRLESVGFQVDYVAIRATDLTAADAQADQWVVLIAARLGNTRLIDNLLVTR
jgi:pantoate--beta-alanine ligase